MKTPAVRPGFWNTALARLQVIGGERRGEQERRLKQRRVVVHVLGRENGSHEAVVGGEGLGLFLKAVVLGIVLQRHLRHWVRLLGSMPAG